MDLTAHKTELWTTGITVLPNVLSSAEVLELQSKLEKPFSEQISHLRLKPENDEKLQCLFDADMERYLAAAKLAQYTPELHAIGSSQIIVDLVFGLGLASPVISTRPVVHIVGNGLAVPKGYQGTPSHQDWRSVQGSLDGLVLWLPLTRHSQAFWPLEVARFSHRLGLLEARPHEFGNIISDEKLGRFPFTQVVAHPGDVVAFSMFLAHRTGRSKGAGVRWAASFRYNNMLEPNFISRGFPNPYIYKSKFDLIDDHFPDVHVLNRFFDKN